MAESGSLDRDARRPSAPALRQRLRSLGRRILAIPLRYGASSTRTMFLAHQPDSYAVHDRHAEFEELRHRFTAHNRRNNSGDLARLWSLLLNLEQIEAEGVRGDFAELGVWRGNTAAVLAHVASRSGRRVFLFDTFTGFDRRDLVGADATNAPEFADTSVAQVRETIGPAAACCEFVRGFFPSTVTATHEGTTFAAVSLDADLYEPMKAGLDFFYPRLAVGGIMFLHDYANPRWPGCRRAVDEFCRQTSQRVVVMPDKSGSAFLRRV